MFGLEAMFQSFGFDFVMPLFHALVMACSFNIPTFFFRFVSDGFVLMASKALLLSSDDFVPGLTCRLHSEPIAPAYCSSFGRQAR